MDTAVSTTNLLTTTNTNIQHREWLQDPTTTSGENIRGLNMTAFKSVTEFGIPVVVVLNCIVSCDVTRFSLVKTYRDFRRKTLTQVPRKGKKNSYKTTRRHFPEEGNLEA